mmetsp:Transcript_23792/g.11475  ORF Transcript_23792/g.11475 Transcript_23792/m.11475 type:complete len:82 (+) Transcript_23792:1447-1692(+)
MRTYGLTCYTRETIVIENVTEREEPHFLEKVYNLDFCKEKGESIKLYTDIHLYQVYRCGADENDVNLEGYMIDLIENLNEK